MYKRVYISWHYTTHGLAYFKHVLSAFHRHPISDSEVQLSGLSQLELNNEFESEPNSCGFLFDEVILLTCPQEAFDGISTRRLAYKAIILEDEIINEFGLKHVYQELLESDFHYDLEKEIQFVADQFPKELDRFMNSIWRNIQHYPVKDQIIWLEQHSNFNNAYHGRFRSVELPITDLRDEKLIVSELANWINEEPLMSQRDTEFIINVSLGSNETQVVWHILAESSRLPPKVRFIKTYDDKKSRPEEKFKEFSISEIPTQIVSDISHDLNVFSNPSSAKRKEVQEKFKVFINAGFSIFILGERGTGKSWLITQIANTLEKQKKVVEANCASFGNSNTAEVEIFGATPGSYTDVPSKGKKGLLQEADNGILFLDEVHFLSKEVQGKLMKAFQTDADNFMTYRQFGGIEEIKMKCQLIFASNKSIDELRDYLLPDFYDRIIQHVLVIPPLRETREDILSDWEQVWDHMRFGVKAPTNKALINWLRQLPLNGNFRDLQKIAMYYKVFSDLKKQNVVSKGTAIAYAKSEFSKYHSKPEISNDYPLFNFRDDKTTKEMIQDYLFKLQEWADKRFGGHTSAIRHFRELGDKVSAKSFWDWKNRKTHNN